MASLRLKNSPCPSQKPTLPRASSLPSLFTVLVLARLVARFTRLAESVDPRRPLVFAVVVSALWWETNEQLVFVVDAVVLVASFLVTVALVREPESAPRPTRVGPGTSTGEYVRDLVRSARRPGA